MNAWIRHRWSWLGPLIFALSGLLLLGFYYLALNGKARALERRLENRIETRDALRQEVSLAQAAVERLEADDRRVTELFGTIEDVPRRMTRYVRLVHQLTRRAGVEISGGVGFGGEEIEDFGLAERSMDFEIRGDFHALRHFINMLELSNAFLTLRDIQVRTDNSEGPNRLVAGLTVSTLFAAEGSEYPVLPVEAETMVDSGADEG